MLNRAAARFSVALVGFALCTGCVTVAEHRALEREVVALKRGEVGGPPGSANSRVAELGVQVDALQDEVDRLRGELEAVRHNADQALEEAEALRREAARRNDRASDRTGGGPAAGTAAPSPGREGGDTAPLRGTGEEVRGYEEAFRLYRTGDYPGAIDRFQGFLQTHPSSEYADNALFWLGECHFKLGDHEKAVLAFDDVVKRFPDGNKVPDALYRQGIALLEIGKQTGQEQTYRPAAQEIFQQLVTNYPDSERVPEARRQLENQVR